MSRHFRFLLPSVCALGLLSSCAPRTTLPAGGAGPPEPIADADPAGPTEDGQLILQRSCTVCHDLGGLSAYANSWGEVEWRSMVETMIAYGAVLTPAEVDTVARYLAVNFGTEGPPEAAGGGSTTEMAVLLESACGTTCHDLTAITASPGAFTADEFRETVERMLSYGAPLSEDQVEPLVEYLVATYGD